MTLCPTTMHAPSTVSANEIERDLSVKAAPLQTKRAREKAPYASDLPRISAGARPSPLVPTAHWTAGASAPENANPLLPRLRVKRRLGARGSEPIVEVPIKTRPEP